MAALSTWAYLRPSGSVPLGEPVTFVFTKGAWVECLANPESQVVVVSVEADGFVILERTPNIKSVMQDPNGTAQCNRIGIRAATAPENFYVPFSTLHKVVNGRRVFWENAGAV
ncbi:hypothetical protein [Paucibacter sp. XJ19-41]|uniref:hypothetical protein n=1 Tax=Paucibacter sp. XJ19-41 TaxID=2927824 RepID=UPI00234A6DF5|nr:hypothetical protein [Paucibacter sp. XJ19-41]MDC6170637.1 hypothetical protein [Paucibacter sp. XJ19-41]